MNGNYVFKPIQEGTNLYLTGSMTGQSLAVPHGYPQYPFNVPIPENGMANTSNQTSYPIPPHAMMPGQPIPGQSMQGQPIQGQPMQVQPMQVQPLQVQPVPGQLMSGQPIPEMIAPPGPDRVYYGYRLPEPPLNMQYRPELCNVAPPEYRVNPPGTYNNMRLNPRADAAVWAPNPGEMFNFGEMLNTLPTTTASQVEQYRPFSPRRSSPVDGAGSRAVGGPVSLPGPTGLGARHCPSPSSAPATTNNRKVPIAIATRIVMGHDNAPNEWANVSDRLAAAYTAYGYTGFDDQELEAGLQALERRIDTEFKNAE